MSRKLKVGIIGSGNIGTDLMIKILRHGEHIEMGAMVGIDAASDGLGRAARMSVATTQKPRGCPRLPTSTSCSMRRLHRPAYNDAFLRTIRPGIRVVDLTPAAIGPYCIPVVNGARHLDAPTSTW